MTDTFDEAIEQYSSDDELEKEIVAEITQQNEENAAEIAEPTQEIPTVQSPQPNEEIELSDDDVIASHLDAIRVQDSASANDETMKLDTVSSFADDETFEEPVAPKKHTLRTIVLIFIGMLILFAAGLSFWVYTVEKKAEGIVPAGVSFANNQSLAGMGEADVKSTIESAAQKLLENNVVVTLSENTTDSFEANTVSKPLSDFVTVDTNKMVGDALQVRQDAPLLTRLEVDLLDKTIDKNIPYVYTIDEKAIASFVSDIAKASNKDARDAELKQANGHIEIVEGAAGFKTNKTKLKKDIAAAVADSLDNNRASAGLTLALAGKKVEPKRTTESIRSTPAIIVTLSTRSVVLYNGDKVVKSYKCAIGTPDHPTPVGNWKIVLKRKNPTWVNPGSDWAKDMPKTIGPGPTNPLGMRALNLNASGIRLHGTTSLSSIGTAASHGCMRMRNEDIIDLFDRVEVGTPVFIIQ